MTGTQARPTIKRRRIGSLLRHYREAHTPRILSKEAARHIGVEPSQLGRIERGEYRIKPAQIESLLRLYDVLDPVVYAELRHAALLPLDAGWWYPYRNDISLSLLDFITLENEATEIRSVTPSGINGLLQCASYASAVQNSSILPAVREQADLFVSVRMSRQRVIRRSKDPVMLRCIMVESAFQLTDPVMEDQIQHLLAVSRQDNVEIQVMPFNAPLGMQVDVHANLLRFRKPWPSVVHVATLGGGFTDDSDKKVQNADMHFKALSNTALPVDKTREFLEERLKRIRHGH